MGAKPDLAPTGWRKGVQSVDWLLWGMLVAAAACEFVGDLAFKWWAETDRWPALAAGLALYALALILFAHMLRRAELAVIFALWVGVAAVLVAVAGWLFFDEALSPRHICGLILVVGGVLLLQSGGAK